MLRLSPRVRAELLLLLINFLFGSSFVTRKLSYDYASPFVSLTVMFTFAMLSVLPIYARNLKLRPLFTSGLLVGLLLFGGFALQTVGLSLTTPQNSSFITAIYVKLVPVVSFLVTRKLPYAVEVIGFLVALLGTWFLTTGGSLDFKLGVGDILTFGCTVCFASHIVALDAVTTPENFASVSVGQVTWVALLSAATLWFVDPIDQSNTSSSSHKDIFLEPTWVFFLCQFHNGVLATGFAFTAIGWCMQHTTTTRTAFICALEPVFAALSSFVYYGETMSRAKLIGALLILLGIFVGASHDVVRWEDGRCVVMWRKDVVVDAQEVLLRSDPTETVKEDSGA